MVGRMNDEPGVAAPNVYQFKVNDAEGNVVQMRKYKGQVMLIVNVSSQSGFTDLNYKQLQELQKVYGDRRFKVLAFPSDQLGNQEPSSAEKILEWAREKGYEFDIFGKIDVNGPNTPLLWRYLKTSTRGMAGDFIKWNFTKFIVNRKGVPVERYGPAVPPSMLKKSLEGLLELES
uniref:Glutathione peroxidase n=1 Tax=Lygus hesperus TaxID=30085 RepID=A0A0A9WS07_LYGHE